MCLGARLAQGAPGAPHRHRCRVGYAHLREHAARPQSLRMAPLHRALGAAHELRGHRRPWDLVFSSALPLRGVRSAPAGMAGPGHRQARSASCCKDTGLGARPHRTTGVVCTGRQGSTRAAGGKVCPAAHFRQISHPTHGAGQCRPGSTATQAGLPAFSIRLTRSGECVPKNPKNPKNLNPHTINPTCRLYSAASTPTSAQLLTPSETPSAPPPSLVTKCASWRKRRAGSASRTALLKGAKGRLWSRSTRPGASPEHGQRAGQPCWTARKAFFSGEVRVLAQSTEHGQQAGRPCWMSRKAFSV